MTNTQELIMQLKKAKEEQGLSLTDIERRISANGDFLSRTAIARVFQDGSEEVGFRYNETLKPLARALLDIENIKDDDILDVKALKAILLIKNGIINDQKIHIAKLESELANEKIKHHEKIEKEREKHQKSIEFLKNQISLKDKRMDFKDSIMIEKEKMNMQLIERIINCQCNCKKEQ